MIGTTHWRGVDSAATRILRPGRGYALTLMDHLIPSSQGIDPVEPAGERMSLGLSAAAPPVPRERDRRDLIFGFGKSVLRRVGISRFFKVWFARLIAFEHQCDFESLDSSMRQVNSMLDHSLVKFAVRCPECEQQWIPSSYLVEVTETGAYNSELSGSGL